MYLLKIFHNYNFTMNRISEEYYLEFLQHYSREFNEANVQGELDKSYFSCGEWERLCMIMQSPKQYYRRYYTHQNKKGSALPDGLRCGCYIGQGKRKIV